MRITLLDSLNINKDISRKHVSFIFLIENITRGLLQETSRSRTLSPTVKSSRYTLQKDLKYEDRFVNIIGDKITYDFKRASKYIKFEDDIIIDKAYVRQLEELRLLVLTGKANDKIKGAIPECYYTKLVLTVTYDDLIHLCKLRLHKSALKEYRVLMKNIIHSLPNTINKEFNELLDTLTKDMI